MSRKPSFLSILALCLSLAAVALSLFTLMQPAAPQSVDYSVEIQALQEHNALLQSRLDALTAQVSDSSLGDGLKSWDLSLTPWTTATGASATLTVSPARFEDGMQAAFSIRLGGKEVEHIPMRWDGSCFTATAELAAEDGYGYYCIVLDPSGEKQQFALTTPENPILDIPVYLSASLSSYCNMTVDSWFDSEGVLNLSLAYVQAQLPRLSASGVMPTIENARLRLYRNGSTYSDALITLEDAGSVGAYELTIAGKNLSMPELQLDDYLDLYLEISLSDGTTLTALAASWYEGEEGLYAVMG